MVVSLSAGVSVLFSINLDYLSTENGLKKPVGQETLVERSDRAK
jgi:hypothetical protein